MFLAVRRTCDGFTVASLGHESAEGNMSTTLFDRPSVTRQALHSSSAVYSGHDLKMFPYQENRNNNP